MLPAAPADAPAWYTSTTHVTEQETAPHNYRWHAALTKQEAAPQDVGEGPADEGRVVGLDEVVRRHEPQPLAVVCVGCKGCMQGQQQGRC